MIASAQPDLNEANPDELLRQIAGLFSPDGALAAPFHSGYGPSSVGNARQGDDFVYEERPQQLEMALAVARAVSVPAHLVVEAGTGVGKTFAYLAPLLYLAANSEKPVAVSTYTINLQEQLAKRDIPFLMQCQNLDLRAVICKGRSNYLCLRRLQLAEQLGPDLFYRRQADALERLRCMAEEMESPGVAMSAAACDGSISAFSDRASEPPPPDLWRQVCSEYDNCLGRKCHYYRRCFLMRARAAAFSANILILNHHLLFSNLAMAGAPDATGTENGFLPEFNTLVLDEAHCIETVASEHFGLRLAQGGLEFWLRRLYNGEVARGDTDTARRKSTGRGLMVVLGDAKGVELLQHAWREAETFFQTIHQLVALKGRETRREVRQPMEYAGMLPERLCEISAILKRRAEATEDQDLQAELNALARRGIAMYETLQAFMRQSLPSQVYWIEAEPGSAKARAGHMKYSLCSAPIEVGPVLQRVLFQGFKSVVMTSATLSVDGTIGYFKERVGGASAEELIVASPFDYMRQMRLFIAADMPDPRAAEFADSLEAGIRYFLRKTSGRAFVLFTNAALMRDMAGRLESFLQELDLPLLVQGRGMSRDAMLRSFRASGRAVLFGLDSFWMGVDVRGQALCNVIITRLPFAVPDEPLTKARMELIRTQGRDPFREYSLPEAVLKFRQGVGRLIRSTTDEGIVVVLDPRIATKYYGRAFLRAIPECPVEIVRMSEYAAGGRNHG